MPPVRLITPTPVGMPGLNHCRALSARPPLMPTTALPGLKTPSVVRAPNLAALALGAAALALAASDALHENALRLVDQNCHLAQFGSHRRKSQWGRKSIKMTPDENIRMIVAQKDLPVYRSGLTALVC